MLTSLLEGSSIATPSHNPVHVVALGQEQLGKIGAVLPCDTRNQRFTCAHRSKTYSQRSAVSQAIVFPGRKPGMFASTPCCLNF